jgi:hypothetical protein
MTIKKSYDCTDLNQDRSVANTIGAVEKFEAEQRDS